MNRHNTDVAACGEDTCKMRLSCLRWWLGTNKDPHQVWANFQLDEDKGGCADYINYEPIKEENNESK